MRSRGETRDPLSTPFWLPARLPSRAPFVRFRQDFPAKFTLVFSRMTGSRTDGCEHQTDERSGWQRVLMRNKEPREELFFLLRHQTDCRSRLGARSAAHGQRWTVSHLSDGGSMDPGSWFTPAPAPEESLAHAVAHAAYVHARDMMQMSWRMLSLLLSSSAALSLSFFPLLLSFALSLSPTPVTLSSFCITPSLLQTLIVQLAGCAKRQGERERGDAGRKERRRILLITLPSSLAGKRSLCVSHILSP